MADTANDSKPRAKHLSSRVMTMKFMQREREMEGLKEVEKAKKRIISEAEWVLEYPEEKVPKPTIRVDHQPSFLGFTESVPIGRQSFQNFNKTIERAGEEVKARQQHGLKKTRYSNTSDSESTDHIQTLRESGKRPSGKKRKMVNGDTSKNKKTPSDNDFIKPT